MDQTTLQHMTAKERQDTVVAVEKAFFENHFQGPKQARRMAEQTVSAVLTYLNFPPEELQKQQARNRG